MAVRPILVVGISCIACAVGVESLVTVRAGPGFSPAGAAPMGPVMLLVAGWAAVAAGIVVQWRHPTRRSWVLLALAGLALFLAEWDNPAARSSAAFSVGLLLAAATPAVLAHHALSFPSGRLGGSLDRAVVGVGYAITIGVLGLGVAALFDPTSAGCSRCHTNLWLSHHDPQLSTNISRAGLRSGLIWTGVVVLVLAIRLATSTTARRRAAGPVWTVTIAYLLAVAVSYRHGLDSGLVGSDLVQARMWLAQSVALLLVSAVALLALVQSRLAQRGLTRLVIDLGNATHPGQLRAALAQRYADPDLVVAYPVDGGRRHVDADARDTTLTPPHPDRMRTTLAYGGSEIATLVHRRGILDTPEAVGELVSAVHLALDSERLRAEALTQLTDLRSSGGRILTAADEERRQLERDLHDGAQQRLIGLALTLRVLRSRATTATHDLDLAESEVREAIDKVRQIARGLYPVVLRESGLAAAVAALSEQRLLRVGDVPKARYPAVVESTAYRFVALASERSSSTVSVDDLGETINVRVDVDADLPDLAEVRDRATTLGGQLTVTNRGTSSRATLVLPTQQGVSNHNDQSPANT